MAAFETSDPRITFLIPFVNGCCNPFAWSPKDIKEAFFEIWDTYQNLLSEGKITPDLDAKFIECIVYLGQNNIPFVKRGFIDTKWRLLKEIVADL